MRIGLNIKKEKNMELLSNPFVLAFIVIVVLQLVTIVLAARAAYVAARTRNAAEESLKIQKDHQEYVKNRNHESRREHGGSRTDKFYKKYPTWRPKP